MPRLPRVAIGETVYHVLNRSNGRVKIFDSDDEYSHFLALLKEGKELTGMRILSYCIMPNHWHLVLYPRDNRDLSEFMRWVTTTHVRQRRTRTNTVGHGHLYQGPFKSFAVQEDKHLVDVIRYVEQNPLRAGLVSSAQEWPWSSLYERIHTKQRKVLNTLPTQLPKNYMESVNDVLATEKLEKIHQSIAKKIPYGSTVGLY